MTDGLGWIGEHWYSGAVVKDGMLADISLTAVRGVDPVEAGMVAGTSTLVTLIRSVMFPDCGSSLRSLTTRAFTVPTGALLMVASHDRVIDEHSSKRVVHIPAGGTVLWVNTSRLAHTVTADDQSWDSGYVDVGETFSMTFDTPGTYSYYCVPHGGLGTGMAASVIVE